MTKALKIVYCSIIIFVWMVLNHLLLESGSGGALTTILMFIMIAMVVSIWRYKPEESDKDDKRTLDKS